MSSLFEKFDEITSQHEVAPGKNKVIYLAGHLVAWHDRIIEALKIGERSYVHYDQIFTSPQQLETVYPSFETIKEDWKAVNIFITAEMKKLTAAQWLDRHAYVSQEDFLREPHRNRLNILLSRTAHVAVHYGQISLAKP